MKCSKCGTELEENAAVCPKCGASVEAEPAARTAEAVEAPRGFSNKRNILIIAIALVVLIIGGAVTAVAVTRGGTQSAESIMTLAERYLKEENYEQAVIEFQRVIELDPMNVDAYLNLAEAYTGLGDTEKALEVLREGLESTGDSRLQDMIDELTKPARSSDNSGVPQSSTVPERSSVVSSSSSTTTSSSTGSTGSSSSTSSSGNTSSIGSSSSTKSSSSSSRSSSSSTASKPQSSDPVIIPEEPGDVVFTAEDAANSLKYLTIENNVITACSKDAIKIVIPDGVTSIGQRAFYNCSSLVGVKFNNDLTSIGSYAFAKTSITKLVLPESLTSLSAFAFDDCKKLASVYIPASLANNDTYNGTFGGCSLLKTVTFGSGITAIPEYLFQGCYGIERIVIPSTVTSIASKAFNGCPSLTEVVFNNNLTSIGSYAFAKTKIEKLVLPESLTTLSAFAFDDCQNLASVYIPASLAKNNTYNGTFGGCPSLKTVTFGSGITAIPEYLFQGCRGIERIEIPSTVTAIANKAFNGCFSLSEVEFNNNLTSIGSYAFAQTNISKLVLPESLTSLSAFAFDDCKKLASVYIPASLAQNNTYNGTFGGCPSLKTITFGSGISAIPEYLFQGCYGIERIEIPSTVTSIANRAFNGCPSLSEVEFNGNLTSIGSYAFAKTPISKAVLPDSLKYLDKYAFNSCANLTSISYKGVTYSPDNIDALYTAVNG